MTASQPRTELSRTLDLADRFLEEVQRDLERFVRRGEDTPPRLRSVHERQGHASPEYRNKAIPLPDEGVESFPEYLSEVIASFAREKRPDRLLLAVAGEQEDGPVLIAEARDGRGTRRFWMQPYRVKQGGVEWPDPLTDGWEDPGEEEMILDRAFLTLGTGGNGCEG